MDKNIIIKNGLIITPEGILEGHNLLIRNGTIKTIGKDVPGTGSKTIDANGKYVTPGLTELHIHGCGRWGFEDIDYFGFKSAANFLFERGITTIIPTLQWDSRAVKNIADIILNYRKKDGRLRIHGIYIEGPFINSKKRGGIQEAFIASPSLSLVKEILEAGRGLIRIMTIAPELPGIESVADLLVRERVIPSLGHSDATVTEAEQLFDRCMKQGVRPGMTHLFNASSPLSHKDPGLAMLPFTRDIFFELNGDGVHVNNVMLKLINSTGFENRMILISDALVSAGIEQETDQGFSYYNTYKAT